MDIITLNSISKSFHGRPVYEDATAHFSSGAITSLVGPNGSGKSLLFRMICGFVAPDRGDIWVDPDYLAPRRDFPERFGVIIDKPGFIQHLTGFANLQMLAKIRKSIGPEEVATAMREFGLDPSLKQKVRHYSLGMRQKLALAQAFMEKPDVLVLDEPFNALDAETVILVRERIQAFKGAGGTVLFTSHNTADIDELSDTVFELQGGHLTAR